MKLENPFTVYSPEDVSPDEFREIFVKDYTWINALETPKDFFIFGVRGSGKSMLLSYLEFSHQIYYFDNDLIRFLEKDKRHKYIGIYVHMTNDGLKTEKYELLIKNNFDETGFIRDLCMTDLVLATLYKILKLFEDVSEITKYVNSIESDLVKGFCSKMYDDFNICGVQESNFDQPSNIEMFSELANIYKKHRVSIDHYANRKFQMKSATYDGNYATADYLISFIQNIKKLLDIENHSFYILFDNGEDAKSMMQSCINELIRLRLHKDVCVKIAIKKGAYWNKKIIQWPHDYSQIDIDELYSTQHNVYSSRIRDIANKRLELAHIDVDIEKFLPESPTEKELLDRVKTDLKEKYENDYEEKYKSGHDEDLPSKSEYVNNRLSKYAQAELFRRLKKTGKSYAGFNNIVHLSSGITRQFLDICSYMFDEEVKRKGDEKITHIDLVPQNEIIKKYADDFMDELEKKYKGFETENNIEEEKRYKSLYTLIESLGKFYKKKLMEPDSREPRVFTFTLKDPDTNQELEKILELAVAESYFHTYWYSSKTGLGKHRGYAFNRRLCPRFGIDPTSFRGRIELSSADLINTIENRQVPKSKWNDEEEQKNVTLDLFG